MPESGLWITAPDTATWGGGGPELTAGAAAPNSYRSAEDEEVVIGRNGSEPTGKRGEKKANFQGAEGVKKQGGLKCQGIRNGHAATGRICLTGVQHFEGRPEEGRGRNGPGLHQGISLQKEAYADIAQHFEFGARSPV